jgi:hypothetical protein
MLSLGLKFCQLVLLYRETAMLPEVEQQYYKAVKILHWKIIKLADSYVARQQCCQLA